VPNLRKVVLWYGAVGLLAGLLRWLAVPGVYHIGSNVHWLWRALLYYFGYFGSFLRSEGWHVPVVVALAGASVGVARRGVGWSMGLLILGVGTVLLLYSHQLGLPLDVAVTVWALQLRWFVALSLWAVAAYLALRFSRQEVVLGVAFVVLGSALTFFATQTLDYTRWLGGFGHSILAWAAIRGMWQGAPLAARQVAPDFGLMRAQPEEPPEEPPESAGEDSK
jgi:hypothetical protein